MQSIEITGKSVEEATKNAAAKLGVAAGDLKVTVLEETKGLFGKSNVRIRAEVAAVAAPKSAVVQAPDPEPEPTTAQEAAAEPEPVQEQPKKEKPRRGRTARPAKAEASAPAEEPATEEFAEEPAAQGPNATDQDAEQLETLVRDLIDSAGLDVKIKGAAVNGRYVNIELDGRDVAHLVGKHGEVLNALQYLVNIVAGRRYNNGIRATLDGNNYRRRREDALYQLAIRVAEEVKSRGEEAVLDALPAFERRIIHKSLSDYEGVQTYSEGEEPNRRVVIAPTE